MAKRFGRKDPKVGEVDGDKTIVHRFLYNGNKYYVTKQEVGPLLLWEDTTNESVKISDEQE